MAEDHKKNRTGDLMPQKRGNGGRWVVIAVIAVLLLIVALAIRACRDDERPVNQVANIIVPDDDVGAEEAGDQTDDAEDEGVAESTASGEVPEENSAETGAAEAPAAEENVTESTGESEEAKEENDSSAAPIIIAESVPDERTLLLSACGDCTMGMDENFDYDTSFNAMYAEMGPEYFFANVQEAFANDDLTIINFEGTLTTSTDRYDKTYSFKGKPEYVDALTAGSVEACNLANNHSYDYGEQSTEDTINYIEEAGIVTFGNRRSPVVEVNGIKVGLVGVHEIFKGYDAEEELVEEIENVKALGAELIIATVHWGTEKEYYPDDIQVTLAHSAIDHGAHLVIGHHPHVLQGIEVYKGRSILYSLGNFCFGGNKNPSDKDTMIYQQRFTVSGGEVLPNEEYTVLPCSLSGHTGYNDYQPRILTGEEGERVSAKIRELSEGLS